MKNKLNQIKSIKKSWCMILCIVLMLAAAGCSSSQGRSQEEGESKEDAAGKAEDDDKNTGEQAADTIEEEGQDAGEMETSEEGDSTGTEPDAMADSGEKPVTMADLLGGDGMEKTETTSFPDTVLWFNATYAPLTYSNGWNWRLPAGLEPTEGNISLDKMLLANSWNVTDRESALETVNSLIQNGHRSKCQECMDELEEWGLIDLPEEEFAEKIIEMETEKNPARYVIAYYMYRSGVPAEYIAAWDLCRVNQLYADYYLCGYMSYEEAMDASLENSLILQEMFDSWEEMMDSYIMGYQFWQGDLGLTEDSPTMERYRYYEMLQKAEDGPYTLDWNMALEKSW